MNKIVSSLASLPPPLLDAAVNSESRNESKSDSSVPPVLSFPSQSSLAALNVAPMLKAKRGRVARPATQPTSNSNTAQLPCPIEGCFTRSGPTALYKHVESHIRGAYSDDSCRPSDKWLQDHKRSVCTNCCGLFSTVRIKSHYLRCVGQLPRDTSTPEPPQDMKLPSVADVFQCWQPVLHVVPPPARFDWARVLHRALDEATDDPSRPN